MENRDRKESLGRELTSLDNQLLYPFTLLLLSTPFR
jgi:hypothetical protein